LKALPVVRDSIAIPGGGMLNNRGLFLPRPLPQPGFEWPLIALAVGIVAAIGFALWARRRQERTGAQAPVFRVTLALVLGLPLLVLALSGFPVQFEFPESGRFNI